MARSATIWTGILALAGGLVAGLAFGTSIEQAHDGNRTPGRPTEESVIRDSKDSKSSARELASARGRITELEAELAKRTSLPPESAAPPAAPKVPSEQPPNDAATLPGAFLGTLQVSRETGNWTLSGAEISADPGQRSDAPRLTLGTTWVDPRRGFVNVTVGNVIDAGSVDSSSLAGMIVAHSTSGPRVRILERVDGKGTGLAPNDKGGWIAGTVASIAKARDRAIAWREVAALWGMPEKAPGAVGACTLRFAVDGVRYTVHVRVEYAAGGDVASLSILGGP